jgi:hypothetical protein
METKRAVDLTEVVEGMEKCNGKVHFNRRIDFR